MKQFSVAVLSGDGIGPEVVSETIRVLNSLEKKFNFKLNYREALVGGAAYDKFKTHLPEETIQVCKSSDAILFGSVGGPISEMSNPKWQDCEIQSILKLRKLFQFCINIRPIRIFPSLIDYSPLRAEKIENVDIVFIRELLGDLYFGEHENGGVTPNRIAYDSGSYTEKQCFEALNYAFQSAEKRRRKVTLVHKSNVLALSKLWVEIGNEVSKLYPEVMYEEMLVDNCAMQLIIKPHQFDVIVTSNLFGDILSDLGAALPGTLGICASASLSENGFGLYEPAGGAAHDIAGKGIANPSAQILSAALMLHHSCNLAAESKHLREAVSKVYEQGIRTPDLGGNSSTKEFTDGVIDNLSN